MAQSTDSSLEIVKKRKKPGKCSGEGCTYVGTTKDPTNLSLWLCQNHFYAKLEELKRRKVVRDLGYHPRDKVDIEREEVEFKVKGDPVLEIANNRELSFSEKIQLLDSLILQKQDESKNFNE